MTSMYMFFSNALTNWKYWLATTFLFILVTSENAYCFETVSLKKYSVLNIPVPSRVDLTKLPRGKTFQVNHSQFTLQFSFNNRDIFGFIFKREPKSGILVHLCFYRTCEESPYDLNQVIAKPQEPPYDRAYFSVKFPPGLQYDFQGLEFLPRK